MIEISALAGRFILTTERHPHGNHLKIRSTKSSQMLVVVEEEVQPLAHAMLNLYREEKPHGHRMHPGLIIIILLGITASLYEWATSRHRR